MLRSPCRPAPARPPTALCLASRPDLRRLHAPRRLVAWPKCLPSLHQAGRGWRELTFREQPVRTGRIGLTVITPARMLAGSPAGWPSLLVRAPCVVCLPVMW